MEASNKGKEKESERIISIPKGKRPFDAALFGATIQKGFAKVSFCAGFLFDPSLLNL